MRKNNKKMFFYYCLYKKQCFLFFYIYEHKYTYHYYFLVKKFLRLNTHYQYQLGNKNNNKWLYTMNNMINGHQVDIFEIKTQSTKT